MPNTVKIDERALREILVDFKVPVSQDYLHEVEAEAVQVKTHSPIKLPDIKLVLKIALIPAGIAVAGVLGYYGYAYLKNIADKAKPDTVSVTEKPVPQVEPPLSKEQVVIQEDTSMQETNTADTISEKPVIKEEKKVINEPVNTERKQEKKRTRKDSVQTIAKKEPETKDTSAAKVIKADSSRQDSAAPVKKKKKRKKNSFMNIEDIQKSTLQPDTKEEDVVVPQ